MTPRVVVVGGSVAGLAAGLCCARRGLATTVIEGDDDAAPRPFDEPAARDPRRATPQAAQSHAFLARAREVLAAEAPGVLDELDELGAPTMVLRPPPEPTRFAAGEVTTTRPGPTEPAVVLARRTTFEAALRTVAATTDGLTLRTGAKVDRLVADDHGPVPVVRGVRLDDGTTIDADVVLDASGRRGRSLDWLTDLGVSVDERSTECGITYHTRFYRLLLGATAGPLNRGYTCGSSFDRYSCLVFPADRETFSVTFGTLPEDRALRGLRDDDAFAAAAAALPLVGEWVDPARSTPISPPRSMTGMRNRLRRTTVDGRPLVLGHALVADAAAISNPAHSRGCALALGHARRLADAVVDHAGEPDAFAGAVDAAVDDLAVWVADSDAQDRARLSRWRADAAPPEPTPFTPPPQGWLTNGEAYVAAHHDPVVWQRFTRLQQLLARPADVLGDADTIARVRQVQADGLGLPAMSAPTHDELAGLVDAAGRVGRAA
ncbi:MAG: FAD-binding protein [Actinomycetota bacterium]|nr:FAD-binding protein [Actinomycetota bacterium]